MILSKNTLIFFSFIKDLRVYFINYTFSFMQKITKMTKDSQCYLQLFDKNFTRDKIIITVVNRKHKIIIYELKG